MSGKEETKCEGGCARASKDLGVLRCDIEVDTTGTVGNVALEGYLTRAECVPQTVEWKGL